MIGSGYMLAFLKKYGFYFMMIAIISESVVPFIFSTMYPNYSQMNMLISDFGEDNSPIQLYFKLWQFVDGSLILLSIPSFYERFKKTSVRASKWLAAAIAIYAFGDCIFTAIFDRTITTGFSLEGSLHDYGSGVGFVAFLVGIFLLMRLYSLEKNPFMVKLLLIIFLIAGVFMILFAAPRFPILDKLNIPYRGLWQRLNLIFLYLPYFIVGVRNTFLKNSIQKKRKVL